MAKKRKAKKTKAKKTKTKKTKTKKTKMKKAAKMSTARKNKPIRQPNPAVATPEPTATYAPPRGLLPST